MSAPAAAACASGGRLRIASFLPAATEMVFQLGLGEFLVGRTHECDSPEEAKSVPVLVDCVLNLEGRTMKEIDEMVSARLREGKSLYNVDEQRLREAQPQLLITQNLCQVRIEWFEVEEGKALWMPNRAKPNQTKTNQT